MGEAAQRRRPPPAQRAHKRLIVWQESMRLVEDVYAATACFPREEMFGLSAQMRRCATSVPSNIAEGSARRTRAELNYYIGVAQGSLSELDTQVEIARRLGLLADDKALQERLDRVFSLLLGMSRALKE